LKLSDLAHICLVLVPNPVRVPRGDRGWLDGLLAPIVLDRLLAVTLDCSCKGYPRALVDIFVWRRLPNALAVSRVGVGNLRFVRNRVADPAVHIAFDEITQRQCAELPHFRRNLVLRSTVIARARVADLTCSSVKTHTDFERSVCQLMIEWMKTQ